MYYSQFGEDRILSEIFGGKGAGMCVEVGANDGVNDSTTLFFENTGWDCILVEPNPVLCKMIRSTRKARLYECAASDRQGTATLYVAEGADRSHGVSMIADDRGARDKIGSYGFTCRPIQVETRTLDDILAEQKPCGGIDFISIDVEGHELEALQGFSVAKWMPSVLIIEDNTRFEDDSVRDYLKRFGYVCFKRTGVNDWYAHRKNRDLVNVRSRAGYWWTAFKEKGKNRLRRMPGYAAIRSLLRGWR